MTRFLLAAAVGTCLLSGCPDGGIGFSGTVIAPPEVQQLFSAEAPGQLIVIAALPSPYNDLSDSEDVFCVPAAGDRRINVHRKAAGCAAALTAQVTAYAIPRTTEQIDCSGVGSVRAQQPYGGDYPWAPADAVAVGSVDAPLALSGSSDCPDGNITFTVTLAPQAATSAK